MLSPLPISISIATRPHSIVNAVTPGDYRRKRLSNLTIPTSKDRDMDIDMDMDMDMDMSWDVTTPATPCSQDEEEEDIGSALHHSMSNASINYTSDEHDTDYEDEEEDEMSTSTSPATSDWESPVSSPSPSARLSCSPVSIPSPRRPRATSSRPWSGCLSCDNPHVGRPCTQSFLLHLATESCRPSASVVSVASPHHTCTSSCTHHSRHIHYQRPAYLLGMKLNPAGFVRVPLPETSDDTESTTLGQRRLVEKKQTTTTTTATSTSAVPVPRRTSISRPAQTPLITPRRASVFTFASTSETIEIPAPSTSTISSQPISAFVAATATATASSATPRMPKLHSISNISLPQSILTPSKSGTFVPLPVVHSASPSPSLSSSSTLSQSLPMCLSPAVHAISQLHISIEVPTVRMSPDIYASKQQQQQQQQHHQVSSRHMQRTASSNAMVHTEEEYGSMSPPLPNSTIIPSWHNKSKYKHSFHHVKAPVARKYHGVLPGASTSTCTSTLPSSWSQSKLFMLYLFYLALNAAFVLVLHH